MGKRLQRVYMGLILPQKPKKLAFECFRFLASIRLPISTERALLGKSDPFALSEMVMATDALVAGTPLVLRALQTRPAAFVRSYLARVEPMLSRPFSVLAYSHSDERFAHQCPSGTCGFGNFSEPVSCSCCFPNF